MKSIISLLASVALLSSGFAFADTDPDAKRIEGLKQFNPADDKVFDAGTERAAEFFTTGNLIADGIAGSFGLLAIFVSLKLGSNANGNGSGGTIGSGGPTGSMGTTGSTGTTGSMGTSGSSGT